MENGESVCLRSNSPFFILNSPFQSGGLMRRELNLGLYLVTDERLSRGRPTAEIVRAAIRGGVDAVQLRGKDLPMREQVAIGRALRAITREAGVLFIVN